MACTTDGLFAVWYCPHVVACFFGPDGRFLREEARDWAVPARWAGVYYTSDPAFRWALDRQLADWQWEIGFRAVTIRVHRFESPTRSIGVTDGLEQFDEADEDDQDDLADRVGRVPPARPVLGQGLLAE